MEFGKPKLPSLPKLAFWKQGEDSELPPPPARHFDPARFGGDAETQVAERAKSHQSEFDQYGMRLKDSAKEASDLASKGFSFPEKTVEKLNSKPARKLYGMDDLGGDEMLAEAEKKFNLDSKNLKNKFDNSTASASNELSNAQQDFRTAMKSTTNAGSSTKNSFAAGDNSFAANPIAKTVDKAKTIGGGGFLPASDAFNNVKLASGETADAAKGVLYDAKGRLASAGSQTKGLAEADLNSMKAKFEQQLLARQKQAAKATDTLSSEVSKSNDQLTALAGVSSKTKDLINQPFPKIAADGSLIPQSKKGSVDLNGGQLALQPSNNPLLGIKKPNALATNSFNAPAANDAISRMRSEVEEAKRELAELKAQVAATKQSAVDATQPVQRFAQNTIEGVVLPLDKVNDAFDPRAGLPVAKQQQGMFNSPATSQPKAPSQPSFNSNTGGGSNSFYPATPYGGFGSTAKPKATVGQVGFNSTNDFQNQVSQASADGDASFYSGPLQANRIDSTVSEVLIPSAVLSGNSSFTPGSTTPLR